MPQNRRHYSNHSKSNGIGKSLAVKSRELAESDSRTAAALSTLGLSEATFDLLVAGGIKQISDLCVRNERDMYRIQKLNKKVLNETVNALKKMGFALAPIPVESDGVANAAVEAETKSEARPEKPKQNANSDRADKQGKQRGDRRDRDNRGERGEKDSKSNNSAPRTRDGDNRNKNAVQNKNSSAPVKEEKAAPLTEPLPIESWHKISRGGKWGFFDGIKTVIPPMYDEVFMFKEGLACVEVDEKCGFINSENDFVIEPIYDTAFSFSEGLAMVEKGGKCGYINKLNEIVIPCEYDAATAFEDGVARVKQFGRWGLITADGVVRWK